MRLLVEGLLLFVLRAPLAIVRLDAVAAVPPWAWSGELCSVTRTVDELSVVCSEGSVPPEARAERGWRALKVQGPLDFSLTGVLAAMTAPLAAASIPIFALSTYETDYVLVHGRDLIRASEALTKAGHVVASQDGS
jgi:hypothetical protein